MSTLTSRRILERLGQDLRYAARTLRRAPVFSTVAVACLTLGIAATTTMFSVFDAIVLRPLPFAHPDELVAVSLRDRARGRRASLRYDEYLAWQREARAFRAMGAHVGRSVTITERNDPERVSGRLVSASLFPLLGARAGIGRLLAPDDDRVGAAPVVIIGDALWRRRFGGDSTVIGRTISLDGATYTVVGVMEAGFAFPSSTELWTPLAPALTASARPPTVSVVGRLRRGTSVAEAAQEAALIGARMTRDTRANDAAATWTGDARSLRGNRLGSDEAVITTAMLGATAFLLLIACANVANLLLARAVTREREIAVRTALGAGRGRIAAQLLTEAMIIAGTACLLALPIVWQSLRLIKAAIPPSDAFPQYMQWSLDFHTFAFATIVTMATGVLFGVGPAIAASNTALHHVLKENTPSGGTSHRRQRFRDVLIVAEVALALVLLVGASLFVRTFVGLRRTELGYDPARVMTMRFYLAGPRYDSVRARGAFVEDVLRRVTAVPGVEAATVSDLIPLDDEGGSNDAAVGDGSSANDATPVAYAALSGRWFETLGVRLTAGRVLTDAEVRGGAPAAVVNQTMANAFWPGASAIGRRFRLTGDSARTWYEVVGVAPDIRTVKLDEDRRTPPTAYIPLRFVPTRDYALMIHTGQRPTSLTTDLRAAIHAADPTVPVFNTWSLDEVRYLSFWMYALWSALFGVFGALALALATIGVYGVIHYSVAQRTREIGVRVALGAQAADVVRLVLGRGMMLTSLGVAAGVLGSIALTRVVGSLLIGVSSTDPTSFIAVPLILAGVSALAAYLPARHATRVDPLIALREE